MSLRAYTAPVESGVRIRHDAKIRLTVTTGRKVLEDRLVLAEAIGGAIAVVGYTYNRLSYSGGVSWWNPATGQPISRPQYKVRVRPSDVLTGDDLCTCPVCS